MATEKVPQLRANGVIASDLGAPLLVGVDSAMKLLSVSRTKIYDLLHTGRMPEPIRLSKRPQWPLAELEAWVSAGCPSRERWEEIRKAVRK